MMRKIYFALLCVALCAVQGFAQKKEPVDYVNTIIGASTSSAAAKSGHGLGKTFPGAATPFGLVQLSPDTITGGENGFNGTIRITPYRSIRGLRLQPKTLKPDETEFQVFLKANANLQGTLTDLIFLSATSRKGNKNYIYTAPPLKYKIHGRQKSKFNSK